MMRRRICAVLLTHDRPNVLRRALDSIERSEVELSTLVIDNGSTRAMAQEVAAACEAHPDVTLHRSERNLGCAGGRSLGHQLAGGELILFLDDDAELLPGALEHMLAELERHPSAGAVSATVITPDGRVSHSGGTLEAAEGVASFGLIGAGQPLESGALPPSGPADWVAGTAVLVRRELLEEFPLDERMAAYHEDNEWCYRISLARSNVFRRSREALVMHHLAPERIDGTERMPPARAIALLTAHARFYERHRMLMGPWVFGLLPGMRATDESFSPDDLRLLMELAAAKGGEWMLRAWSDGALSGLLSAHSRRVDLDHATAQLELVMAQNSELFETLAAKEVTTAFLHERHETLRRVEDGGWWRLRGRMLPLLRMLERARRLLGA